METQTDTSFEEAMAAPKRPQFLTVICVLSFIMCAFLFITNIWNAIQNTPEHLMESAEQVRGFSPQMADQLEQQAVAMQDSTYLQIRPYLDILFILISFLGVLMMWKLNKNGFWLYLVGELAPYLGLVLAAKETMAMMSANGKAGEIGGVIGISLMVVFDIAFFIMYAANLKHMQK
jgi:hypothetical protein